MRAVLCKILTAVVRTLGPNIEQTGREQGHGESVFEGLEVCNAVL